MTAKNWRRYISGILTAIILINQLSFLDIPHIGIPKVQAEGSESVTSIKSYRNNKELGLIAVLVENTLLDNSQLREQIFAYAQNAQSRTPHSQAFVMGINSNESVYKIATTLEHLYYEGMDSDLLDNNESNDDIIKEDDNKLIGIVLIGNVPIPVVKKDDGTSVPSMYPYTDFYRKKYIYSYETNSYEINGEVGTPNPEIWHGVIVPPKKSKENTIEQLVEYFKKNASYSAGNEKYTNFEKRMLYADFPQMEKQMNFIDYRNYERYGDYMEEMAFNRYNKHLLKEVVKEVSTDIGSSELMIPEETIDIMYDVSTEYIIKKYMYPFSEALKIFRGRLNDVIKDTGRWSPSETDTPDSLISVRDEYGKYRLRKTQLQLEKKINDEIKKTPRPISIPTSSELTITVTKITETIDEETGEVIKTEEDIGEETLAFENYMNGKPADEIATVKGCGIYRGSKRKKNENVLENNSVFVEANRLYDLKSLLLPPEDDNSWKLEEDEDYKKYAGCVFNNSEIVDTEEIQLGPYKCIPEEAEEPIFSIAGSKEVTDIPEVSVLDQCLGGNTNFKPEKEITDDTKLGNDTWKEGIKTIILQTYNSAKEKKLISKAPAEQEYLYLMRYLTSSGKTFSYYPIPEIKVTVKTKSEHKAIEGFRKNGEPFNSTIQAIKHIGEKRIDPKTGEIKFPQILTPSIPADGKRSVDFMKGNVKQNFQYLNFFKIGGRNPDKIKDNLLEKIIKKDSDLSEKLGYAVNINNQYFADHSKLFEPITWKTLSIDQKLTSIIPKYIDKKSILPSPDNDPKKSPQNKPKGYEVLHIAAKGDTWGYQIGLNRAMQDANNKSIKSLTKTNEDKGNEDESGDTEKNGSSDDNTKTNDDEKFKCGDPSGVEIWEWFEALQCWIKEEILPASELFKMDDSCGGSISEEETEEEIAEELEFILNPESSTKNTPVKLDLSMDAKSLAVGQEVTIRLYPLNKNNESVMGYISDPVKLTLSTPSVGEFDKNNFNIFTGEDEVKFTAKKAGTTKLTVSMGNIKSSPYNFIINVYDSIGIKWEDRLKKENGQNKFEINITLVSPKNQPINNINGNIILAPLKPTDGGFVNNGKVNITNGKGNTVFIPTPGPEKINLISRDANYKSMPYVITQPPNQPVKLVITKIPYIKAGRVGKIPVKAVDSYGMTVKNFNKTITVKLSKETKSYADVITSTLNLSNGEGVIKLQARKNTATLNLIASYKKLKKGKAEIPILARVESEDWNEMYTQNLFASFVGFPAGNIFEKDYFGGTHLFNGKTEAVYSFMEVPMPPAVVTVKPNYQIILSAPQQKVYIELPNNAVMFQVFDKKTLETLISKNIPLNFKDIIIKNNDSPPPENVMAVEILNDSFIAQKAGDYIVVKDAFNKKILSIGKNNINIIDFNYNLEYNAESELPMPELVLTDGFGEAARIILSFKKEKLNAKKFEINKSLEARKMFSGISTNEANGLILYDPTAEPEEEDREEYYGLEGENKYIKLFAGGMPIGDAVKPNLPTSAILLGDPTIQLKTKSVPSLNHDESIGKKIFQDPEGSHVVSMNSFNFNNDNYEDIAMVMKDGRIRLMEGGAIDSELKDRGDIAFLADGAVAIEKFDFKNDGYEDLLVATEKGRLAILNNDREVITRKDQQIKVGKKLYTLLRGDMDADGFEDLVTLDSRGDIRIFYNKDNKFPENGELVANYGFSINLDKNLYKDIDARWPKLDDRIKETGIPISETHYPIIEPSESDMKAITDLSEGNVENPSNKRSERMHKSLSELAEAGRENPVSAINPAGLLKLPWPEGMDTGTKSDDKTETYFSPVEDVGFLHITKKVHRQKTSGEEDTDIEEKVKTEVIDLEEKLVYTITIKSDKNVSNGIFADTVPDALLADTNSVECKGFGCGNMEVKQNGIKLFFGGIKLKPGNVTIITYIAEVKHTPKAGVFIKKLKEPAFLNDVYPEILVSPPYNNTGQLIQHYTSSVNPRKYKARTTFEDKTEPSDVESAVSEYDDFIHALKNIDPENPVLPPFPESMGASMEESLDEMTGNNECFDTGGLTGGLNCASYMLDKIAGMISEFGCKGGGCFPIPWNFTLLVPPEMPLPLLAFPAGLGPWPLPGTMAMPGAAAIPGLYQSMIRFYLGVSLTGGIGISLCWGPYMGSSTPPPPVFPLPYPPPIGNCMVIVPPSPLGPLCDIIEDGINKLMELINSGMSKINSASASLNNNDSIPIGFTKGNPEGGAGGLEVTLGINLGESMKFEPPVQGFSNIHIPTFDSLMGKISGWVDRQTLEIMNKLFTLPTFYVYLPDFKSIFSLDFDRTKERFEVWKGNMSKSGSETTEALKQLSGTPNVRKEESTSQKIKTLGSLQDARALDYANAVETQVFAYNMNSLQGLYDVASTLPLINITEVPVSFTIPWLSAAEIQAYIMELQRWMMYYEREFERVKDKWEKLSCSDLKGENAGKRSAECVGRTIADSFTADFDKVLESIQKNIEVLQSYLLFPRQLVKFKKQLADYIRGIACYMDTISQMMGGWMGTLRQQIIGWAELYFTIQEIIKNWKELFDVFINFDLSCAICTNERMANPGWWMLLGLIIPDIPIIAFPKWPDIVFDLSDIDAAINVELPIIHLTTQEIKLPSLPYIRLPDFPTFNLLLQLPPLPILPKLPPLPDLPPLPPIPILELPTLPAPPKLPDMGIPFEIIIQIIEQILNIWCLMKKAFAPVPESMLNDQITLLTNRPAYLIPLDTLKLQLPNIAGFDLGFNELRIETIVYIGIRFSIVPDILEKWAQYQRKWVKDTFTDGLPNKMQKWIDEQEERVQGELDRWETAMKEGAQTAEEWAAGLTKGMEEDIKTLDDIFREKEEEWQKKADEYKLDWTYDEYTKKVQDVNKDINEKLTNLKKDFGKFFAAFGETANWINLLKGFEYAEIHRENNIEYIEKYNKYLEACFENARECDNPEKYINKQIISYINDADVGSAKMHPRTVDTIHESPEIHESPQPQQLQNLINELIAVTEKINKAPLTDYKKIKEELNVPDFEMTPKKTTLDKIEWMKKQIISYSDILDTEAEDMKNVTDLYALAKVPPIEIFPYELAKSEYKPLIEKEKSRIFTSAIMPKITNTVKNNESVIFEKRIERQVKTTGESESLTANSSYCRGICLPDTNIGQLVPFMPNVDYPKNSEILLLKSGHRIYSDGNSVYLKKDLTIPKENMNKGKPVPNRIFELDEEFMMQIRQSPHLAEAVNMLKPTLAENGNSTFGWKEVENPDLYGYGIELEHSILGFDTDTQNNGLADTKIVLLPPNENDNEPDVFADGIHVTYGTLITNLEDESEVEKKFGIKGGKILTGINNVVFPSINGAVIKLNKNKAVYFDEYTGSNYSVNMDNGYYHIKMTWFDTKGNFSTYNQNELLSPQLYVNSAPPIDIAQNDEYYVPIYKEKIIQASNILVDLNNVYKYYWYVDTENNPITPKTGDELIIPPQKELKEFYVKLIASKNIEDPNFEQFEKTFKVIVYAPPIELKKEPVSEGIISGNLINIPEAPEDNLDDIPFSLFRKRHGIWKNLGIIAGDKTSPPINDHTGHRYTYNDSYYTNGENGSYHITGLNTLHPSPIILKDSEEKDIAKILPDGEIIILNENYTMEAFPASVNLPTRISIINNKDGSIASSIYYIANKTIGITIINEELNAENISNQGVTAGDINIEDDIIAGKIPKNAPSFPGGIAIYNQTPPQKNIALIDTDGAIRMMQGGYSLKIKNLEKEQKYIFQIINEENLPIFDVYIQPDTNNLTINTSEAMSEQTKVIGLKEKTERIFAPLLPSAPETDSPFADLDNSHPYYNEILELYKKRIIKGYGDGLFKPNEKLTRAEFIKIALGVTNCYDCQTPTDPQREKYTPIAPFPDVKLPAWYYFCIWIAKELGMITGYGDGMFRPAKNISRAEAAAVLLRQSEIEITENPENFFADIPEYAWYKDYVYTAVDIGLIKEHGGFVFPDEEITRGEFAFMSKGIMDMQNCREKDEDKDGMPDWWEMENNLDPLFYGDAGTDYDFDGLTALQEYKKGTNPYNSDTDNDGITDNLDASEEVCPCIDNPNQNDTDGDGIIDACDIDLDNDGIPNALCIFYENGLINPEKKKESEDNCIFTENTDQQDSDLNDTGDLCEEEEVCPCIDNPNQNDTDGDGIIDACDVDLDNDGIPNALCIFDEDGLLDPGKKDKSEDNCIFTENTDQQDSDLNDTGDLCEEEDMCPEVPEDTDGTEDEDGCPEVDDEREDEISGTHIVSGESCTLSDYESDLAEGDIVMTAITDIETHEIIFKSSKEVPYLP